MSDDYRQLTDAARETDSYWVEAAKVDFAIALGQRLREAALSRGALAARLGTSAAYITKALRGDTNFTIESMVRLCRAVGGRLHLHIAREDADGRWLEVIRGRRGAPPSPQATAQAWAQHSREGRDERVSTAA